MYTQAHTFLIENNHISTHLKFTRSTKRNLILSLYQSYAKIQATVKKTLTLYLYFLQLSTPANPLLHTHKTTPLRPFPVHTFFCF